MLLKYVIIIKNRSTKSCACRDACLVEHWRLCHGEATAEWHSAAADRHRAEHEHATSVQRPGERWSRRGEARRWRLFRRGRRIRSCSTKFHLRGDGPINPPFRLILDLRTRLIRVADGTLIHEETFESESTKRTFVEWAENDAQPLREGLDSVALKLANDIVARVLTSGESRR